MASNHLHDKTIRAALKTATETGNPLTINDGDGLTLIARPDGGGWWRRLVAPAVLAGES